MLTPASTPRLLNCRSIIFARSLLSVRLACELPLFCKANEYDLFVAGRRTREVGCHAVEVVNGFVVKLAAAGSEAEVDAQSFGVCR